MTLTELKQIVKESLEGKELKGFYPSVSVSETSFGTSFYIQNEYSKIRISDHSVSNFDRMMNEELFSLDNLDINLLKTDIVKQFTNDYVNLSLYNGSSCVNFRMKVLKSDLPNWKTSKVYFKEEQIIPIKLEDIKNWEVLELRDFTKKGDKRFCKVLKLKYSFGTKNIKTGQVIRTRFFLNCEPETVVNL